MNRRRVKSPIQENKMRRILLIEALLLLSLAACNGGGGSGSAGIGSSSPSITSQFIDAPVKGLNVERSISGSTTTGDQGKFTCIANEVVTFKLRDLEIGSTTCGAAIYLDEVAPPATVDRFAAVLQSLSTTDPSSGLIDLSSIPSDHLLKNSIDLTSDSALDTSIRSVKLTLPSVNFSLPDPVNPTDARAHVNANLPQVDDSTKATLDSFIESPPTIKLTRTNKIANYGEAYYEFYTAKLVITKEGNVYKAALDEIAESNGAPITKAECLVTGECELDDWKINGISRVVTSNTLTFGALSNNTLTVLTSPETDSEGIEWPIGSAKIVQKTLLSGGNLKARPAHYKFYWSDGVLVSNKSTYFPFVFDEGISIKVKIGNNGTISGEAVVKEYYVGKVKTYVSFDDYTFDTNDKTSATYSISVH